MTKEAVLRFVDWLFNNTHRVWLTHFEGCYLESCDENDMKIKINLENFSLWEMSWLLSCRNIDQLVRVFFWTNISAVEFLKIYKIEFQLEISSL